MSRQSLGQRSRLLHRACFLAAASIGVATASGQVGSTWLAPAFGIWSDPANWSTNPAYPNNPADDAFFTATGSPYTVTLNSPVSLHSLTGTSPDATLNLNTGGTLTLSSSLDLGPGTVTLAGGKIVGGTVASPLSAPSGISTLDNTTLATQFTLAGGSVSAAGTVTLAPGSSIRFASSATSGGSLILPGGSLAGTSDIVFDSTSTSSPRIVGVSADLTIGPDITIRTGPNLTSPLAAIGSSHYYDPLVNHGTISAQTPGQALTLNTRSLTNTGTIEAKNGGILRLAGSYTPDSISSITTSDGGSILLCGTLDGPVTSTLNLTASHALALGPGGTIGGRTITTTDNTPLAVRPYDGSTTSSTITNASVITPVSLLTGASLTVSHGTFYSAITGASATLTLRDYWYCPSISLSDSSTLNLERTFSGATESISLTDSTANIQTTFDNTRCTLSLSPSSNLIVGGASPTPGIYVGATLTGGTIKGDGTVTLDYPYPTTNSIIHLTDVTLADRTNLVVASGTTAELRNSFTLDGGRISLVNDGATTILHLDSLAGSGEIVFDGSSPSFSSVGARDSFLPCDLPTTFTIRTGTQGGYVLCGTMAGLISAQTPGKTLHLTADKITGIVEARNGGTVSLNTDPYHTLFSPAGPGRVTLTSGTFNVYDGSSLVALDGTYGNRIVANAANITVSGPTAAAYDVLNYLESNTGSLTFTDGYKAVTISTSLTNTGSITIGTSSAFRVKGALTNPGSITLTSLTSVLLIDYAGPSPLDALRNDLLTGHLTTPLANYAIAYADASQLNLTTYAGFTVDDTTLLTKLTLSGDANLDGAITPDDYAMLDRAFAQNLSNPHWTDGDFNYDGVIDQSDYLLIDTTFGQTQGLSPAFLSMRESQFGAAYVSQLVAAVPEPASAFTTLALVALTFGRRRQPRGT